MQAAHERTSHCARSSLPPSPLTCCCVASASRLMTIQEMLPATHRTSEINLPFLKWCAAQHSQGPSRRHTVLALAPQVPSPDGRPEGELDRTPHFSDEQSQGEDLRAAPQPAVQSLSVTAVRWRVLVVRVGVTHPSPLSCPPPICPHTWVC